jgi:hypothetical protein
MSTEKERINEIVSCEVADIVEKLKPYCDLLSKINLLKKEKRKMEDRKALYENLLIATTEDIEKLNERIESLYVQAGKSLWKTL